MIEAMKQALEALEFFEKAGLATVTTLDAITSLHQAIAEAENQEPVKWQDTRKTWVDIPLKNVLKAKREWVGMTDEEKNEITWGKTVYEILDLAEAKLKEKNT
jgi:hypothetical protein